MNKQDYIQYWLDTSINDFSSMESNFQAGKYDWALFIGHLCIEKLLKAFWVKFNESNFPPKTHNLLKLSEEAGLELSEEQLLLLHTVNRFQIETRYPDYKQDFSKECTMDFAQEYLSKIKEFYQCIHKTI